ncbi:MAG: hypothetical protein PVJ86_02995 [Phycisphaerales bacterium]|jgi:hypothetical protein
MPVGESRIDQAEQWEAVRKAGYEKTPADPWEVAKKQGLNRLQVSNLQSVYELYSFSKEPVNTKSYKNGFYGISRPF